ncbi:MAG TPA: hypothetical protein VJR25_12115 [Microbacterium sp.]|uniref:hypothetical protein n=1 Tax=Microbacterium sp. TaxID=51671 RepID=UPI002B483F0C|nr:hypothetical protein [Microbacterium sp.]HKT57507.1 hypothetical protein [Microbacterium sp.]
MNTSNASGTPASAAADVTANPLLPGGDDERFTGFGVMGLGFSGGHYLALRVWTATSIGAPYRAVWHRDPHGRWHMVTTAPAEFSCPRYFSTAATSERAGSIDLDWLDETRLRVRIPGVLEWDVALRATPATRAMTALAGAMPPAARRSDPLLGAMGPLSRPMLRAGRMRLTGAAPNRQRFQVVPLRVWRVAGSTATLAGAGLGEPRALGQQTRLGDFWMPQRGIFYVGEARFDAFDPARHAPADAPVAAG